MQQSEITLQFLDILLDETLLSGTLYIPYACFQKTGTFNRRLPEKQIYEFLIRLAFDFEIHLSKKVPVDAAQCMKLDLSVPLQSKEGLQTDCYIIARYKKNLLDQGFFDAAIQNILAISKQLGCQKEIVVFLEQMLSEKHLYQYYYQGSQPFLIYIGVDTCYQLLDAFALSLGNALQKKGYLVEYFNLKRETITDASKFIGKSYQAVIGMQSYMFTVRMENGVFLHDKIAGPKYNFVFDHPLWLHRQIKSVPLDLILLTLDKDYVTYIRHYYNMCAHFLPPGGIYGELIQPENFCAQPIHEQGKLSRKIPCTDCPFQKRIYNITFIGSYIDNSVKIFQQLRQQDRQIRFFINRCWLLMRKHPRFCVEDIILQTLHFYGWELSEDEFSELCYQMREYILYLSHYFRYQLLKTLTDNDIQVHVFGTSWKNCRLLENPNFIWHNQDLTTAECLSVWQQSKIALNIMSGHKNAVTERIVNSMLQKAAVCTERNSYLESQFQDGSDVIYYDLAHLDSLPKRLASLLANTQQLEQIAENGCKKAFYYHTWDNRAQALLELSDLDTQTKEL